MSQFILFCCGICFVAMALFCCGTIYALLRVEKFTQKLCLWRKKDKYQVWIWLYSLWPQHLYSCILYLVKLVLWYCVFCFRSSFYHFRLEITDNLGNVLLIVLSSINKSPPLQSTLTPNCDPQISNLEKVFCNLSNPSIGVHLISVSMTTDELDSMANSYFITNHKIRSLYVRWYNSLESVIVPKRTCSFTFVNNVTA